MSFLRNLKPHVRTVEIVGDLGYGKTTTAAVCASPKTVRFLNSGGGNSERLIIFTTELKGAMVVAVSFSEEILSRDLFSDIFTRAMAKVTREHSRVVATVVGKDEEALADFLREEVENSHRVKTLFSLLSESKREEFFSKAVSVYHNYEFRYNHYEIYNCAKQNIKDVSIKENSERFLSFLQSEVKRFLDIAGENFKKDFWGILNDVNDELGTLFFKYFNRENLSKDGYYYKEMSLDNPDGVFVQAVFEDKPSLSEIADEVVIYVPMHEKIESILREEPKLFEAFRNSEGEYTFGVIDSRYPFAPVNSREERENISSSLMKRNVDGLLMMLPLNQEPSRELLEFYEDLLKGMERSVPVFLLHNKLDLFVESARHAVFYDDPLSTDMSNEDFVSADKMISEIQKREIALKSMLSSEKYEIHSLSFYLRRDHTFSRELVEKYNVIHVYKSILESVSLSLGNMGAKLLLKVEEPEGASVEIDRKACKSIFNDHIRAVRTDREVFTPALINIGRNLGLNPHPSEYRALKCRLKHGEGYTSILEREFSDNDSFSVDFTENLKNFMTSEFLSSLVSQTIALKGAHFESTEAMDAFKEIVKYYFDKRTLLKKLIYDHAVCEGDRIAFSDKLKFQNFLQNSLDYFNLSKLNAEEYINTLVEMLNSAAERALHLNTFSAVV